MLLLCYLIVIDCVIVMLLIVLLLLLCYCYVIDCVIDCVIITQQKHLSMIADDC